MELIEESENGNIERVREILESGADINIQNTYGTTAVIEASSYGHLKILRLLLNRGADPNIQTNAGATALMWASEFEYIDIVKLLLNSRADPNIQNRNGDTALMLALVEGHRPGYLAVIRLLLNKGADPNIHNNQEYTPLMLASDTGHTEIVDLLKRHMNIIKMQSRVRGKRTRRKDRTQKAKQGLSLGKALDDGSSTYSENMRRYQPEIAEMISQRLSEMPYNPEVTRRMKEEDENERISEYLETMKKYGGRKKKKRNKKKKKTQKKKKKKKKSKKKKH